MIGTLARGKYALLRGVGVAVIGFGLSACEPAPESTMNVVYLPASTPVLKASVERDKQLVSGTYKDDVPEYTGAPGPDGKWPAYVPSKRTTVFRGVDTRISSDN